MSFPAVADRPEGRSRGGGPRRRPPRPVEVVAIERLTERMLAITFGGQALAGFPVPPPTAHIKLFLPDSSRVVAVPIAGPDGLTWPDGRPTMRTYTPRRVDPERGTLEVWFVLHGAGPAGEWAASATVGDRAAIGGPGGRFAVDPEATQWWIGGDESALPAIATLIEGLPETARADVHLEVSSSSDEVVMPAHAGVTVTWHHRDDSLHSSLDEALRKAILAEATHVWVACEAQVVRRLRTHLLAERGLDPAHVTTRGYWRDGAANHPDHDFGED